MEAILQIGRIVAVTVLLLVVVVAHATVNPPVAVSQDEEQEEECLDNEELGPCVEAEHVFDNMCEGNVCYSALEACCLPGVGLVPR